MKLLFVMRHAGYVRNFESTLRLLCDRGHHVHVAFQGKTKYPQLDSVDIPRQLAEQYVDFSYGDIGPRTDGWGLLGRELRLGLDYLRYLNREYDAAPKLRERATWTAPPSLLKRTKRGFAATVPGRRLIEARLRASNRVIPTDPVIDDYLRKMQPDVVAVTPLIEPGSPQSEYLRSARALGLRTACCVASWDNLTNKGLIHGPVDLVAVWNDAMKGEAIEMHGVPRDRVVVTGAAAFDHWFDWKPSVTREAFCARVGLPTDRPYLVYLCSSKFVAPQEATFVRTWLGKLRESSGPLREIGVLVRPHPQNAEQWEGVNLNILGPAVVWPQAATAPVDARTRSDYFDTIYHSAGVVGVNTTAEIESAIVGRPVHTVLAPEFRGTQEGTLHFQHLRHAGGGLLHVAPDFEEHFAQLEESVKDPEADRERARRFLQSFVRPYGLDVAATPRLVDALERLAAGPPVRESAPVWATFVRKRLEPRATGLAQQAARDAKAKAGSVRVAAGKQARTKAEWVERQQHVRDMIRGFQEMGEVDRRLVVTGILDHLPGESFIEIVAANKPRRLDYEHAEIYLRVTSKTETFRVKACAKEPFTIDWIHSRIKEGDVLYDIGANVGAYSLVAAKKPGGGARVYSFEAGSANIAALSANVALNGLAGLVTPLPVALSDRTAMDVFNLRDIEPGGARHALGQNATPEDGPTLFPQPVMVFRLDDLVEQFGLPPANHIKLDVDGGELAVLNGAARTLASPHLRSLLVEVSTSLSEAVTAALGQSDLCLRAKILKQNKAGEYAVWYGLFERGGGPQTPVVITEHVE